MRLLVVVGGSKGVCETKVKNILRIKQAESSENFCIFVKKYREIIAVNIRVIVHFRVVCRTFSSCHLCEV